MVLDKKWSILIWSVFLLVFISSSFIYISSQISKLITLNTNLYTSIYNNIFSSEKVSYSKYFNDISSINLWNNERLVFDFVSNFTWSLQKNEKIDFRFTGNSSWSIDIVSGWPLFYKVLVFSWGTWTWNITSSWIIENSTFYTIPIDTTFDNWLLYLENLWGHVIFSLSSNWNIIFPYNFYKIFKTIWNREVIKTSWKIKNYVIWTWSWGIDLRKWGMYR